MLNKKYFFNFFIGFLGIILFYISSLLYKNNNHNFIYIFLFSIILIWIFYYFLYEENTEGYYIFKYYEKNIVILLLKLLNATFLFLLAIYFYIKKIEVLFYISSFFSLLQIILALRIKNVENLKEKYKKQNILYIKSYINFSFFIIFSIIAMFLLKEKYISYSFIFIFIGSLFLQNLFNKNLETDEKFIKLEYFILTIIFILAIFFRIYKIEDIPPGYTYDARRLFTIILDLNSGKNFGVYLSQWDLNIASFWAYFIYYFTKIFGLDILNLRIHMIIFSIITLPFFFLLVKEMYNKKVAIFSTIFFALGFNFILFSRLDNLVYLPVFLLITGMFFLLRGIKKGNIVFLILASILASLNVYSYHPGKMHVFIMVLCLMFYTFSIVNLKKTSKNLFVFIGETLAFIIVLFPLLYYSIYHFDKVSSRGKLFVPSQNVDLIRYFFSNAYDIIISFITTGSNYEYVNLPYRTIFIGIEKLFFIMGLSYLFYGIKRKSNMTILIWLFFGALPEVFFFHHANPYYFRMILMFPALAIITGLGVYVFYTFLKLITPFLFHKYIFILLTGILILNSTLSTYKDYFKKYANSQIIMDQFDYVNKKIGDIIIKNSKNADVYISWFLQNTRPYFFIRRYKVNSKINIVNVATLKISDFYNIKKDIFIVAEGIYARYFEYFKEFFPDIKIEKYYNEHKLKLWVDPVVNSYEFITIYIPYKNIKDIFGLNISYKNNKTIFDGIIEIPEYGKYKFYNDKNLPMKIFIDDKSFSEKIISEGLHKIRIEIPKKINENIKFMWKYNKKISAIKVKYLIKKGKIFGLEAVYKSKKYNKIINIRREPNFSHRFYWYLHDLNLKEDESSFIAKWSGFFKAEKEGTYSFKFVFPPISKNKVIIDNKIFKSEKNKKNIVNFDIYLTKGKHKINIFSDTTILQSETMCHVLKIKKPDENNYELISYKDFLPY